MLIVYFLTYASSTFNPFWGVFDSQNKQLNSSNWKKKVEVEKKRQGQERKQLKLSGKIAQCLLHFSCSTESALKQSECKV